MVHRSKENHGWPKNACNIHNFASSLVDLVSSWCTRMTVFYHSMVSIRKDSHSCFQPNVDRLSRTKLHAQESHSVRRQQCYVHFLSNIILLLKLLQMIENLSLQKYIGLITLVNSEIVSDLKWT